MKNNLPKIVKRPSKRLGRGIGSGKGGHTSSRGQKGQKSRGSVHVLFEGLKVKKSFLKRLPLQRGKGKFHATSNPVVIKYKDLESLPNGSKIDIALLIKEKLVDAKKVKKFGVKILEAGKNTKKFEFSVPVSKINV